MSSIVVAGDTSGSVTLQAPATAGSVVVTLPSASGTMAVTGGSPSFGPVSINIANVATAALTQTNSQNAQTLILGNSYNYNANGGDSAVASSGGLLFSANTKQVYIDSSGNLNIGNNTSANPFSYLRFGGSQYSASDIRPVDYGSHTSGLGFYTDNSADTTINPTEKVRISAAGALRLGPNVSTSSAFAVAATWPNNSVTVAGADNAGSIINLGTSSSATFRINNGNNGWAMLLLSEYNSGGTAVMYAGYSNVTAMIYSGQGTIFAAGTPSSTQVGVTFSNSGSTVTLTTGSAKTALVKVLAFTPSLDVT